MRRSPPCTRSPKKFKVGISLYGNTPSPTRDSFTWMIEGSILRVVRFARRLKAMR